MNSVVEKQVARDGTQKRKTDGNHASEEKRQQAFAHVSFHIVPPRPCIHLKLPEGETAPLQ